MKRIQVESCLVRAAYILRLLGLLSSWLLFPLSRPWFRRVFLIFNLTAIHSALVSLYYAKFCCKKYRMTVYVSMVLLHVIHLGVAQRDQGARHICFTTILQPQYRSIHQYDSSNEET